MFCLVLHEKTLPTSSSSKEILHDTLPQFLRKIMLSFLSILSLTFLLPSLVQSVESLTSQELYEGIQNGRFDVIVDTRTRAEWNTGHLPNATFLDSLNNFNTTGQISTPNDLDGCKGACTIVVYCRTGARAALAAKILEDNGFKSPVYNGLGVAQWTAAGHALVNTPSLVPACKGTNGNVCLDTVTTLPPTLSPVSSCAGRGMSCGVNSDCCDGLSCRSFRCFRLGRDDKDAKKLSAGRGGAGAGQSMN